MEVGKARLLLHRLLQLPHRAVRLATLQAGAGREQPRLQVARVEAQGLADFAQRLRRPSRLEQRSCQEVAPVRESGLLPGREPQRLDRLSETP